MPSVKLINNPNRSMNPFKGQFLLAMRVASRKDLTKGKVEGAGNYLFNHYMELIELEDYLIEYLNKKIANRGVDRTVTKWPIDEDLAKAYLYYKDFFQEREHDLELTEIWTDLRMQINKVDDFIEEELKKIWEATSAITPEIYEKVAHSEVYYYKGDKNNLVCTYPYIDPDNKPRLLFFHISKNEVVRVAFDER